MKRGSASGLPRYIKVETVHIGDTIKVAKASGDVTIVTTGTVAERSYDGSYRRLYSREGILIAEYNPELSRKLTVTLLACAPTREQPALFDLE